MKEQDLKDAELAERLLNTNDFLSWLELEQRWLDRETNLYLEYKNPNASPAREDAEKREYKGGILMLKRIIKKPNALKEQLKRYRQNPPTSKVAKKGG